MPGIETVRAFQQEVDAAIIDANQAQAGNYPDARIVRDHPVNGLEYFQHAVADQHGLGELHILARGIRFAAPRDKYKNRVTIATPEPVIGGVRDRLVRTVEFGRDRGIALFVSSGIIRTVLNDEHAEQALYAARFPQKSTPAKFELARLNEKEEVQFEGWKMQSREGAWRQLEHQGEK